MSKEAMTLAFDYANAKATWYVESLYGTSKSYTAEKEREMEAAHTALREALAQQTPEDLGYVPFSQDGKSVFIDGFGMVPLAYPNLGAEQPAQQTPYGWVRPNPSFNSGIFNAGPQCPPGWEGSAVAVYTTAQPGPVTDTEQEPVATVIKNGADRQWMSERLRHLPDGFYSLYTTPQPAQQEHNELATALYQARYALRDYDAKQPNCGFEKLANFCQQAADLLLAEQPAQQEQVNKYCCHLCFNRSGQMFLDRMILCPECGNKRCTKATHHELQCTKSNDPAPQPAQEAAQQAQRKPVTKDDIRSFGGIVHSDGNIFFTNIEQLNKLVGIKENT